MRVVRSLRLASISVSNRPSSLLDRHFEGEILASLRGVRQEPEEPDVKTLGRVGRDRLRHVGP